MVSIRIRLLCRRLLLQGREGALPTERVSLSGKRVPARSGMGQVRC
jgi:hypothetical protein